jgi:hypothetical protein
LNKNQIPPSLTPSEKIGLPITEEPSHTTGRTDHVSGNSVVAFGYAGTRRLIRQINFQAGINQEQKNIY